MIKRIKRKNLDLDKYTNCLNKAVNYCVYAEFWYLDVVTNKQWDCYIFNDYEAVMPLPFIKKLGIKIISQPIHCQQLGVFHTANFTENLFTAFLKKLKFNLVRGYHFNEENLNYFSEKQPYKINQILNLNSDYNTFKTKLRKNRKQELNKGLPHPYTIITSVTDTSFLSLLKTEYQEQKQQLFLDRIAPLVNIIQTKQLGITINIIQQNTVVASSFYVKSGKRIIQLFNAKKSNLNFNANTFIVDYMIQEYQNSDYILDFEGSSIKGVNEFNASFRAITKKIPIYKSTII